MRLAIFASIFSLIGCVGLCSAYNFLMVLNSAGRSHFNVGHALAKGLVAKGHEITVVSVFPLKKPIPGYHDVDVPNVIKVMQGDIAALWQSIQKPLTEKLMDHYQMGFRITRGLFEDPNFQKLLVSNSTFDGVICESFYNDAHYGLAEHFKAPLIALSTGGALTFISDMVGSPAPPSFVPHIMLSFGDHMTFYERLVNVLFLAYERFLLDYYYLPKQAEIYREFFPHNKHNFYEMRRNASLVLINQHFSLGFPRPYAPNMIEVAGLHVDDNQKPLPPAIEKFINESNHGAIYFSMGSNLKSKDLPAEKIAEILQAFRGLKQRVLWKFELDDLPNKPDNVYISNWFPQTDILAHPNILAFITHGGMLSTTESIYLGKPVIGYPIFSDQFSNMAHAEQIGYGIKLDFQKLNSKDLRAAIERITSVRSYSERVQAISQRYRDQQQKPLDNAVFWVEHVVRHKGADYLKSAGQRLNWWQYHIVDVLAVISISVILTLTVLFWALWKLLSKLLNGKTKNIKEKQKRN
ncbi:UDP-glycosyltransferase UGT5 [Drosophila willistoni]|uniref:UDP-glycosyltransferase UGT5 n=1 Tax=Drosophila willistoni TaxID=7260 RepID=UPI000C26CEBC|nr:UDP-glycosyltransferase UGT5 [Drosophila willistoni]